MRTLPFFKPKNKPQFAGLNVSDASSGGGGGGDTSSLVNKSDITPIILIGTTNTSGNAISAGTWFYLNGEIVKAKVDIASNATFTLNTNYEKKTIGAELAELNSNLSDWTRASDLNAFNRSSFTSFVAQHEVMLLPIYADFSLGPVIHVPKNLLGANESYLTKFVFPNSGVAQVTSSTSNYTYTGVTMVLVLYK